MKLSVGLLAGLVAADNYPEPVKSLQRIQGFASELLFQSGAFEHKSEAWRNRWFTKFRRNAGRMARGMSLKCAFYDADIHTFNYEYDTENACNGIKMIMDGFSTWVENHLSRCSGQRKHNHHQKRLDKWSDILSDALDCEAKASFQIYASEPSL